MKLQFTNGYRPRFDQISRIMQYLLAQGDRKRILQQEIVAALGTPERQVENLTSMMTGFGLVQPRVAKLTSLGNAIIMSDPYFEKVETLWIIHYIVSSNPELVVWNRIINVVIPNNDNISVEAVSDKYFSDLAPIFSTKSIKEKLPKEVGAVLASYTRSSLGRLNILLEDGAGKFTPGKPVEIPKLAFLFCLLNYRDRFSPGSSAMNIQDICSGVNSLGKVFNIPEYQLRDILGLLHDSAYVRTEQFGDLDQVRLSDSVTQSSILALLYGGERVP